jgi:hypothetical protein
MRSNFIYRCNHSLRVLPKQLRFIRGNLPKVLRRWQKRRIINATLSDHPYHLNWHLMCQMVPKRDALFYFFSQVIPYFLRFGGRNGLEQSVG